MISFPSPIQPVVLAISLLVIAGSCGQQRPEPEKSTPSPATTMQKQYPAFNGDRAFRSLTAQTDFGPRNPGSKGHDQCLAYLEKELRSTADLVTLQKFTVNGYGETLKLTNLFAQFRPQAAKRILLTAHWDSRPRADEEQDPAKRNSPIIGANDGASGVAILLELARIMKQTPPSIGVDILLTDGEDYGDSRKDGNTELYFLGARHFAKTKPESYLPEFGILLDMVGDRDLQLPLEQHSLKYAPQVVDLVWNTAEEVHSTAFVRTIGEAISDDHLPLNEAGIPTIDLIDFQYPYWHTHQDTPDKCSAESLEAVGRVLSALIYTKM